MDWKQTLRTNFTNFDALADFLELSADQRKFFISKPRFSINVPHRLAAKIEKGNLEDPLLKQFLPMQEENVTQVGFTQDPVGDLKVQKTGRLLHKYKGRILVVMTSACAMHCRYCFRQNYPYEMKEKIFDDELKAIQEDPTIEEVILSGGDPLSLSNRTLALFFDQLKLIPHIKRVRFHTRFPIGIPERIDEEFLNLLSSLPWQVWFVIHSNHPRELDSDVIAALKAIQVLGIPILNQMVLLKGVNDSVEVLKEMCSLLIAHCFQPYYLHQLDRVEGAHHFEVNEKAGLEFIRALEAELPGYALPKYVRESSGEPSKTAITSAREF